MIVLFNFKEIDLEFLNGKYYKTDYWYFVVLEEELIGKLVLVEFWKGEVGYMG